MKVDLTEAEILEAIGNGWFAKTGSKITRVYVNLRTEDGGFKCTLYTGEDRLEFLESLKES